MTSRNWVNFPASQTFDMRYLPFLLLLSLCLLGDNARAGMIEGTPQSAKAVAEYFTTEKQTASGRAPEKLPTENATKAKISESQASEIALKKIPGDVTAVAIEKKQGKRVYVVEIIAKKNGKETDVFVDMNTGKVLGID